MLKPVAAVVPAGVSEKTIPAEKKQTKQSRYFVLFEQPAEFVNMRTFRKQENPKIPRSQDPGGGRTN